MRRLACYHAAVCVFAAGSTDGDCHVPGASRGKSRGGLCPYFSMTHEPEGWIKLHRRLLEWEWWEDHNTTRLFLYLLITANHAPKRWKGISIPIGSLIVGRKALAESLGLSEKNVRTALEHLKSTNEVAIKSYSFCSLIEIKNWKKYQMTGQQSGQRPANDRPPLKNERMKEPNPSPDGVGVDNDVDKIMARARKLSRDDPGWSDVLAAFRALRYVARIEGDKVTFKPGNRSDDGWRVEGGAGWVSYGGPIRNKLEFRKGNAVLIL